MQSEPFPIHPFAPVLRTALPTREPCGPMATEAQTMKVTLLGTGCPPPVMNRFGPSTLVEAGNENSYSMPVAATFSASCRQRSP